MTRENTFYTSLKSEQSVLSVSVDLYLEREILGLFASAYQGRGGGQS